MTPNHLRRLKSVISLVVLPLLGAPGYGGAQTPLPEDLRPFVQIAYPTRDGSGAAPYGSGTIVTAGGLILTNEHVFNVPDSIAAKLGIDASEALIFFDDDQDRHTPPLPLYIAEKLAYWYSAFPGEPAYDVAAMRIVRDARTGAVVSTPFPYASLGNPFDIPDGAVITFLGFPGIGGRNLAHTLGTFTAYQEGGPFRDDLAPDGSLLVSGNIWGGNSGGAAIYNGELIGLPTAGGNGAAWVHPVTWAEPLFTYLRERLGVETPSIPTDWVRTRKNRDRWTRERATLLGIVRDTAGRPVESATVFVYADRLGSVEEVRRLHVADGGGIPFARIRDARIEYAVDATDDQGFFSTWIERESPFRVAIVHPRHRTYESNVFEPAGHFSQVFGAPFQLEPATAATVGGTVQFACVATARRRTIAMREPKFEFGQGAAVRTLERGEVAWVRTSAKASGIWIPVWGISRGVGGRSRMWSGWVLRSAVRVPDYCVDF